MHVRRAVTAALALFFLSISAEGAERYTVPFFPAPGASGDPQGVLRIVNDSEEAATVEVFAIADDGTRSGPATVALGAASAAEFDATELRSANAAKGLSGGLGSFSGDVRLSIASDVPVVPLAFVRASDGSLSAMHDTVRAASSESGGDYRYNVPIFNLSTAVAQASRLRLINPGDTPAAVAIGGRDDGGSATMGTVQLSLPAGGARTLTAQQLEAGGAGLTGTLGAGIGRWRLSVSSDRPLRVVNIAVSPTGHRNNLSTTAVRGAAPADRAGFDDRFAGESAVLETEGGLAVTIAGNGRFSATLQSDGMVATDEGGYDYAGLGPDAGRLTLDYDGGTRCLANLYFSSRTSGWFASHCTGGGDPDTWSGGNWFVGEDEDGGGDDPVETTYGMDEALPGVPASGLFVPARLSGGSSRTTGGSTTIELNDGGYFDLSDGTRYTCASAGGCAVTDGTVTRGTIAGTAAGTGEVDRFPTFRTATNPGNRTYTVGTAIDALTLPEATGGNGPLTYSLSPNVPGLMFNATARRLDGTPSTAGSYAMRYTVRDADGDTDTLRFSITVSGGDGETGSLGVCEVGMTLSSGQSCTYPGTTDEFSVNTRGRGSFLGRLAGIRIRINNETINGRVYDFEASHQGEGVWRIDRVGAADGGDGGTPDLTVSAPSASDAGPAPGGAFTLSATVRNDGDAEAPATTLRYYRSADSTVAAGDTEVGTDAVGRLAASATSSESIRLTAPSTAGTYYYGACVDSVSGETDTANNCSAAVAVTVSGGGGGGGSTSFEAGNTLTELPTGFFGANLSGGSMRLSGGNTIIELNHGGYFEYGGYRYTCQTAGGCRIENRRVESGTIARTATGTAPGDGGGGGGGGGGTAPPVSGNPVSGSITGCSGTRNSFSGLVDVSISGTVQASRAVSFVRVEGRANGQFVGIDSLGSLSAGQSASFSVSGPITTSASSLTCEVEISFVELTSGNQSPGVVENAVGGMVR